MGTLSAPVNLATALPPPCGLSVGTSEQSRNRIAFVIE